MGTNRVLVVLAVALSVGVPAVRAQAPVRCNGPLALDQLVGLLKGGVAEPRVKEIVGECRVSFAFDAVAERMLRGAGASDGVIAAVVLRAAAKPTGPIVRGLRPWLLSRAREDTPPYPISRAFFFRLRSSLASASRLGVLIPDALASTIKNS